MSMRPRTEHPRAPRDDLRQAFLEKCRDDLVTQRDQRFVAPWDAGALHRRMSRSEGSQETVGLERALPEDVDGEEVFA